MILKTERLLLREMTERDFGALGLGGFGYNAALSVYFRRSES